SDNEKGLGRDFAAACKSIGIKIETTAENTDEQKVSKRQQGRTIMQRTRALRFHQDCQKTSLMSSLSQQAYVYRRDIKAADKTEPRAHIGYLVGYDSSNIYRVWIPTLDRVIRTRDVIFKWQFSYKDDKLNNITTNKITKQEVETLDLEQPHFTATADDLYTTEQLDQHLEEMEISAAYSDRSPMDLTKGTMSPSRSPSPTNSTIAVLQRPTPSMESRHAYDIPGYLPDRHNNNALQALHPDIGDHNVITGSRRSRAKKGQDRVSSNFFTYYGTFATSLHPTLYEKITAITPKTRLHRDQMPEPPKRFKDEMDDCWKKGCFENTKVTLFTADAETLPLMWVYTNKFDEDGYFLKAKARLVVRGDLQTQWGDTYAATLAAKTFRALVAMSTKFGLLMFQYDAMNAFLNARVPKKLYCNTPEGFTTQFGALLLLRRALYGLKEAPLLWYQDLANTLQDLGLKQIPNTPCLFANNSLIVFFYVDDIVVLVHPSKLDIYKEFQDKLFKKYKLRSMGQLNWFLGIRVVRDISQQSTWLIQDAFIDKVAHKYNLMEGATTLPDFPMAETNLEPNTVVDKALKKRYQQLVGSLAYISVFTRPDISLTHSILSRYLNNPGEQHLRAAIHAWRFLVKTRNFALKASALTPDNTDASFADDLSTRRSSDGYLFKLFGMPIDWKATKQRSVTKSTTEAELYALSHATSEFIWWNNLFDQLNFKTDITPVIYCDNKQTVGIVTKATERLQTKLKHVDIHQL
ncbi:hypothetical protein Ptr86124_013971, partial [Pyrenophora tritici-repentis]